MPLTFLCLAAVTIDGDTIRCANIAAAGGRVRLAGIDAPELPGHCAPGRRCASGDGYAAKAALAKMLKGRVTCEQADTSPDRPGFQQYDRYGRIVARCRAGGRDLGEAMLAAGHAARWPR